MRVLEEDLGPAQLVVRLAQHLLADLVARLATVHLVRRGTAVDKAPGYVLLNTRVVFRDKKGWTSRVGLANRLPQKDKW